MFEELVLPLDVPGDEAPVLVPGAVVSFLDGLGVPVSCLSGAAFEELVYSGLVPLGASRPQDAVRLVVVCYLGDYTTRKSVTISPLAYSGDVVHAMAGDFGRFQVGLLFLA